MNDTIQPWVGTDVTDEQFDRWLDQLRQNLAVENWREVGTTGNPAFENSWANQGTTATAFYKDPFGRVHLKGSIDTGASATTAFTLPTDYRPTEQLLFPTLQTAGAAGSYVTIDTDGTVDPVRTGATVYLNNISFRV